MATCTQRKTVTFGHLRPLTVVRDNGTTLEVSAGVNDGDQVILNPPSDIGEGRMVNAHPAAAPNG